MLHDERPLYGRAGETSELVGLAGLRVWSLADWPEVGYKQNSKKGTYNCITNAYAIRRRRSGAYSLLHRTPNSSQLKTWMREKQTNKKKKKKKKKTTKNGQKILSIYTI